MNRSAGVEKGYYKEKIILKINKQQMQSENHQVLPEIVDINSQSRLGQNRLSEQENAHSQSRAGPSSYFRALINKKYIYNMQNQFDTLNAKKFVLPRSDRAAFVNIGERCDGINSRSSSRQVVTLEPKRITSQVGSGSKELIPKLKSKNKDRSAKARSGSRVAAGVHVAVGRRIPATFRSIEVKSRNGPKDQL